MHANPVPPWAGKQPRDWQAQALPIALDALRRRENAIICAIMGSGKSVLIAEVCASGRGRVVVTVPTVALVVQLAATIGTRCPGEVGTFYGDSKQTDKRITVVCLASLGTYAAATAHLEAPALWIADEAHKTEAERVLEAHAKLPGVANVETVASGPAPPRVSKWIKIGPSPSSLAASLFALHLAKTICLSDLRAYATNK